jgi:hypothetical protein
MRVNTVAPHSLAWIAQSSLLRLVDYIVTAIESQKSTHTAHRVYKDTSSIDGISILSALVSQSVSTRGTSAVTFVCAGFHICILIEASTLRTVLQREHLETNT